MAIGGVGAYFPSPQGGPGSCKSGTQAEIEKLERQKMGILAGTGGIGLERLDEIDRRIEQLRMQGAAEGPAACPAQFQPAPWMNSLGNAQGVLANLGLAAPAQQREPGGVFPGWFGR